MIHVPVAVARPDWTVAELVQAVSRRYRADPGPLALPIVAYVLGWTGGCSDVRPDRVVLAGVEQDYGAAVVTAAAAVGRTATGAARSTEWSLRQTLGERFTAMEQNGVSIEGWLIRTGRRRVPEIGFAWATGAAAVAELRRELGINRRKLLTYWCPAVLAHAD